MWELVVGLCLSLLRGSVHSEQGYYGNLHGSIEGSGGTLRASTLRSLSGVAKGVRPDMFQRSRLGMWMGK